MLVPINKCTYFKTSRKDSETLLKYATIEIDLELLPFTNTI